jgi:pimeloyl-ACP methyl ester carboxylesterase
MERMPVDGVELEYELRGNGDPLVLIHAGVCADFFAPLAGEPAIAERHTVLRYHRAGYGGSDRVEGGLSLAEQAGHCLELMRRLGMERAHVAGHSSSASMALRLALDAPEAVSSLILLEPARPAAPSAAQSEMVRSVAEPALERYRADDPDGAVDTWMRGVCGPGYRAPLERAIPSAFEQAVADAHAFFGQELPAVMEWSFGRDEAARLTQPTLVVSGQRSIDVFHERCELLARWLPNARRVEIPRVTHLLHVEDPPAVAQVLAAFLVPAQASRGGFPGSASSGGRSGRPPDQTASGAGGG